MPKIRFKHLLIFMGVLAIAYFIILFFTLKTDKREVSTLPPYAELLNKELSLKEEVYIFLNEKELSRAADYLMVNKTNSKNVFSDEQYLLDLGHKIKLTEALHFTGGVSGFTASYVVGETYVPALNDTVKFEYVWGSEVVSLIKDGPLRFTFNKAPWQEKALEGMYSF